MIHKVGENTGPYFCLFVFGTIAWRLNLYQKKQNKWNLKGMQDYVITSVADEM